MTTYVNGQPVAVPATIAGVRAILSDADRAAFDAEIETTPAIQLPATLIRWALPPEAIRADDEAVARLRAGDFSGCVSLDGDAHHPGA
ncbi:hypothetical protein JJV70_04690 [Streptomyces sp. JJ66]|nr:hypothetical protein [Streptomyces sp. JJ66]